MKPDDMPEPEGPYGPPTAMRSLTPIYVPNFEHPPTGPHPSRTPPEVQKDTIETYFDETLRLCDELMESVDGRERKFFS